MLSTIFFLSNRLTKAITGLSEMDKVIDNFVKKENQRLDDDSSSSGVVVMKRDLTKLWEMT